MQLNVLDDLAEAMKALDGKKQSRYICHHSGRKSGQQEQPGGRAVPIRRLGGFVGEPISYQGLSANTRLERTDDSKKGIWKPIQSSRLAESQQMIQPDGSNNQQAGNSDVQIQNEKAQISNRIFPRSWERNAAPSELWNAWAVLNLLRLACHIDWLFFRSRSQRQEGILYNVDRTFLDHSTWFFHA